MRKNAEKFIFVRKYSATKTLVTDNHLNTFDRQLNHGGAFFDDADVHDGISDAYKHKKEIKKLERFFANSANFF
jgi:chromosome condensin MukBEF complex kleisin-like MukF subunit